MKRLIAQEKLTFGSIAELQGALTKLNAAARMASNGTYGGSSAILVEETSGWHVKSVCLMEETLSDGSKAYNAVVTF